MNSFFSIGSVVPLLRILRALVARSRSGRECGRLDGRADDQRYSQNDTSISHIRRPVMMIRRPRRSTHWWPIPRWFHCNARRRRIGCAPTKRGQKGNNMTMSSIRRVFRRAGRRCRAEWRNCMGRAPAPCRGVRRSYPKRSRKGALPTLKMPSARGWSDGQKPVRHRAQGQCVCEPDLKHPRWINVLPNGDVSHCRVEPDRRTSQQPYSITRCATMRRARANQNN